MKRKLLISNKDLRGKFAESIYKPLLETDLSIVGIGAAISAAEKNEKFLKEIDDFFKKEDTVIFRSFSVPVADGKAIYQVINQDVNSGQFLVKRCTGICLDEYADGYLGNECWADGDFVIRQIKREDAMAKLFSPKKKPIAEKSV